MLKLKTLDASKINLYILEHIFFVASVTIYANPIMAESFYRKSAQQNDVWQVSWQLISLKSSSNMKSTITPLEKNK